MHTLVVVPFESHKPTGPEADIASLYNLYKYTQILSSTVVAFPVTSVALRSRDSVMIIDIHTCIIYYY